MFLMPAPANVVALPSITYVSNAGSSSALTTYTFSNQNTGVAAADRKTVVGFSASGVSNTDPTTMTIDGDSADLRVFHRYYSTTVGIFDMENASGTSEDIVLTFAGGKSLCAIGVWSAYGMATGAPSDTADGRADPADLTMTIPALGGAVGYTRDSGDEEYTWTGLTEDYQLNYGGEIQTDTGAHDVFATLQTELTINADCNEENFGAAVAYAPLA